ncbi:MAG: peptidyl-prolyl cis-trans isomerase [Marinicella sp.]
MKSILLSFLLLLLAACSTQTSELSDNSKVLVKVGDKVITEKYLQAYMYNRGIKEPNKEQLDQAVDALIKQQALLLQAERQGLQLSLEQQLSVQQLKDQTLSQLAVEAYLEKNPITDEAIRAEYDSITNELQGIEYKVRHMLFQDEVQALSRLDIIDEGQEYLTVEQAYLKEFSQIKNVGDIGWVNIKQVPESFQQPLKSLSPGEVFKQVVISQYGAHVLYLEDQRKTDPPAFELVKDGIKKSLTIKAKNRYEQIALAKAKVTK